MPVVYSKKIVIVAPTDWTDGEAEEFLEQFQRMMDSHMKELSDEWQEKLNDFFQVAVWRNLRKGFKPFWPEVEIRLEE